MVSLGFTKEQFPAGVHICQIFQDNEEREDALLNYLLSGLQSGERTACFSDRTSGPVISEFLGRHGISCEKAQASDALMLAAPQEIYFEGNRFDPDRMLTLLRDYHQTSVRNGYPAARVIGEMTPAIQRTPGGSRLMEYESKVSLLQRKHPVTAVCQYDARSFDGAMIMDILKVHPLMILRGTVIRNPFYIPPEKFLAH